MLHLIDQVLGPFFTLGFHLFEGVELDFVLGGVDELLFDVVLLGKSIEPKSAPDIPHISHHRKGAWV